MLEATSITRGVRLGYQLRHAKNRTQCDRANANAQWKKKEQNTGVKQCKSFVFVE